MSIDKENQQCYDFIEFAGVLELADNLDSKSSLRKEVRVQVPPPAFCFKMNKNNGYKWTSELAYSIGLIVTDGNLSPDKRHISITSSDKQLLRTFRKCLNLKNRITKNPKGSYTKKQCYRIQFGNVSFYNWLVSIGLMPRKTFLLKDIKIPNKFLGDFLRGHLDGDGSIVTYIDKYNTFKNPKYIYKRLYVSFLSGSIHHIRWVSRKIKECFNIKGTINTLEGKNSKSGRKTIWKLKYAKKTSIRLLKFIYYQTNLPCLNRKRKIAENFMQELENSSGRQIPTFK